MLFEEKNSSLEKKKRKTRNKIVDLALQALKKAETLVVSVFFGWNNPLKFD